MCSPRYFVECFKCVELRHMREKRNLMQGSNGQERKADEKQLCTEVGAGENINDSINCIWRSQKNKRVFFICLQALKKVVKRNKTPKAWRIVKVAEFSFDFNKS